jgi:hypothetical protein
LEAQEDGKPEEASKAKLKVEQLLGVVTARFRAATQRGGEAEAVREAFLGWLDVLEMYLRITAPNGSWEGPIEVLACALADLDKGIIQPIVRATKVVDDPGGKRKQGVRAVAFKVRIALAADETSDEEIYQRVKSVAAAYGVKMSSKDAIKETRGSAGRANGRSV